MGMVHAVQKGELSPKEVGPAVRKAAREMKYSDAKDYAETKHKGLPEKKAALKKVKPVLEKIGIAGGSGPSYKWIGKTWKGIGKFQLKGDKAFRVVKINSEMTAKEIENLVMKTKPGNIIKKGSVQMKYFEKNAKEWSTGDIVGAGAGMGLGAAYMDINKRKKEIKALYQAGIKRGMRPGKAKALLGLGLGVRASIFGGAGAGMGAILAPSKK